MKKSLLSLLFVITSFSLISQTSDSAQSEQFKNTDLIKWTNTEDSTITIIGTIINVSDFTINDKSLIQLVRVCDTSEEFKSIKDTILGRYMQKTVKVGESGVVQMVFNEEGLRYRSDCPKTFFSESGIFEFSDIKLEPGKKYVISAQYISNTCSLLYSIDGTEVVLNIPTENKGWHINVGDVSVNLPSRK